MKSLYAILGLSAAFTMLGCTPSSKQLKEAIEKDPSIVFVAIEKDPEKFIEVVNAAAKGAQQKAMEKQNEEANQKREEEFKSPLKPEIQADRAIHGPADAKITIVEYSDFQCPYCRRGQETLKDVMKAYPNQIRFIFKHYPLPGHPLARPAARYFEAVAKQGAEMAYKFHDQLFQHQSKFNEKGEAYLKEAAKEVGANLKKIEKDLKDPSIDARIKEDQDEAQRFDVTGTPAFLINGVSLRGAYPVSEFKTIIDRLLSGSAPAAAEATEATASPAPTAAPAAAPEAEGEKAK